MPSVSSLSSLITSPIPLWIRVVRDPLIRQFKTELKQIQLKPVKRLDFEFDPFHPNVQSIREFLESISSPKVRATNPKCGLKTSIVCQRQEPTITVLLENGRKVIFKTSLLTTLEIAENLNKIIDRLNRSQQITSTFDSK